MRWTTGCLALGLALVGCGPHSEDGASAKRTLDPYFVGVWKGDQRKLATGEPDFGAKGDKPKTVDTTVEMRADGSATMRQVLTDVPFKDATVPFLTIAVEAKWSLYSDKLVFVAQHAEVDGQASGKALEQFKEAKPKIAHDAMQPAFFGVTKVNHDTFDLRDGQPGYVRMHRKA